MSAQDSKTSGSKKSCNYFVEKIMEANPNQQQIPQVGHVSCSQVSAKEFAAKFSSKRECYTFLAVENDVYLPPYGKFPPSPRLTFLFLQTT